MRPATLAFLALLACTPPPAGSIAPTLGEVVGRVDVPRLLECAAMSGSARARCLGASVLTSALDLAVDKAADLAEMARSSLNPQAGAEVSDADKAKLAEQLDAALLEVAREAEAAQ